MSVHPGRHLSEEALVLYYYREGETARAAEHLAGCAECREALAGLERELRPADGLRVPERAPSYPDDVWERVSARLTPAAAPRQAARRESWRERLGPAFAVRTLTWAGGLAAVVLLAFWLGYGAGGGGAEPIPEPVRERILLVAVGDHLERSQRLLIELVHAEADGKLDVSAQRAAAERLAGQNRLYRQTALARLGDDENVSELLADLERLLVEIANGPDSLARHELTQLQRRIERRGILFKMRVIGNDVRQQEGAPPPRT